MTEPVELDAMLAGADSPSAQPDPAPKSKKLPTPEANYELPNVPSPDSSTEASAIHTRTRPKRSRTWVQRVTNENLMETAADRKLCGMLPKPSKAFIRAAKIFSPLMAIGVLTTLGNIAYALLEGDAEIQQNAAYQGFLSNLKATTNITEEQFETLLSYTGREHLPQDKAVETHDSAAKWDFPNHHTFYFSFSIISTIGYGSIVPSTSGGKLFTVIYSLIGIPFCVTAVSICAAEVLYLCEWLAVSRMDQVRVAFQGYDTDGSNTLDMDEFRAALVDLGINAREEDFQMLVEEIDEDENRTLDLAEFKRAVTLLRLPVGRVARTKVRLQISVIVSVLWLFLGMFVIHQIERWDYLDSFYYSVMTLTTVGLGDFVPASRSGTVFSFFYCMVGLGLIALLVTAIGEFSEAVKNKAEQKAAAAVVHAAARAATAGHAMGTSMRTSKVFNRRSTRAPRPDDSVEESAESIMQAFDSNHDGVLDVHEVVRPQPFPSHH